MAEQDSTPKKHTKLGGVFQKANKLKKMMEEERKLTRLFYKSLEANYLNIKQSGRNSKNAQEKDFFEKSMTTIENILQDEENMSWENAYFVEQLLIPLYDDNNLDVELNRRLVDGQSDLSPKKAAYYQEAAKTEDNPKKRALLKKLIAEPAVVGPNSRAGTALCAIDPPQYWMDIYDVCYDFCDSYFTPGYHCSLVAVRLEPGCH